MLKENQVFSNKSGETGKQMIVEETVHTTTSSIDMHYALFKIQMHDEARKGPIYLYLGQK